MTFRLSSVSPPGPATHVDAAPNEVGPFALAEAHRLEQVVVDGPAARGDALVVQLVVFVELDFQPVDLVVTVQIVEPGVVDSLPLLLVEVVEEEVPARRVDEGLVYELVVVFLVVFFLCSG